MNCEKCDQRQPAPPRNADERPHPARVSTHSAELGKVTDEVEAGVVMCRGEHLHVWMPATLMPSQVRCVHTAPFLHILSRALLPRLSAPHPCRPRAGSCTPTATTATSAPPVAQLPTPLTHLPSLHPFQAFSSTVLSSKGWFVHPQVGWLTMFDGTYLHGVVPGRGPSPQAGKSTPSPVGLFTYPMVLSTQSCVDMLANIQLYNHTLTSEALRTDC